MIRTQIHFLSYRAFPSLPGLSAPHHTQYFAATKGCNPTQVLPRHPSSDWQLLKEPLSSFSRFSPLLSGSCSANTTHSVLLPKFQLQPHDLFVHEQKASPVSEYELQPWIHPWLNRVFIPAVNSAPAGRESLPTSVPCEGRASGGSSTNTAEKASLTCLLWIKYPAQL